MNALDVGAREALQDVITKVLKKVASQPEPKEEELDDTLLTWHLCKYLGLKTFFKSKKKFGEFVLHFVKYCEIHSSTVKFFVSFNTVSVSFFIVLSQKMPSDKADYRYICINKNHCVSLFKKCVKKFLNDKLNHLILWNLMLSPLITNFW